jgi:hypothetical protein
VFCLYIIDMRGGLIRRRSHFQSNSYVSLGSFVNPGCQHVRGVELTLQRQLSSRWHQRRLFMYSTQPCSFESLTATCERHAQQLPELKAAVQRPRSHPHSLALACDSPFSRKNKGLQNPSITTTLELKRGELHFQEGISRSFSAVA